MDPLIFDAAECGADGATRSMNVGLTSKPSSHHRRLPGLRIKSDHVLREAARCFPVKNLYFWNVASTFAMADLVISTVVRGNLPNGFAVKKL
jgi:hypothetical protein